MMTLRYDPPSGIYTSRIPPGVAAFRRVTAPHFGFTRTEVVRDKARCEGQSSEHCECRAEDSFTTDLTPQGKGRRFFEWCISVADPLGIQSVIFNHRVWGFGDWRERPYHGPSPHTDHVHTGFNKWAAVNLTDELVKAYLPGQGGDDVSEADVKAALDKYGRGPDGTSLLGRLDRDTDVLIGLDGRLKALEEKVKGIFEAVTSGGGEGGLTSTQIEAALRKVLKEGIG